LTGDATRRGRRIRRGHPPSGSPRILWISRANRVVDVRRGDAGGRAGGPFRNHQV